MKQPKRNTQIKYINPEIPSFELPKVRGSCYQVKTPDTLDLAERATEAIHGLTAPTDPDADHEIYWRVVFGWKPIAMYHDWNDHVESKYYAPSMLLRFICGSDELMEVEWHRMATLLQMQGPDGLLYTPMAGRPWGPIFGSAGETYERQVGDQMMDAPMFGRYLESAAVYHALTGDPQWETLGRKAVAGIRHLVIDKGDFAYLDNLLYGLGEKSVPGPIPPPTINHGYIWLGHGLTTYYRMTGSEEALDMGYKLARFFSRGHSGWVGPKGEFRLWPSDKDAQNPMGYVHFHTNTLIRMLMLDAGIAKGDREMIEVAQRGYLYGRDNEESNALMGYFPETLGPKELKWMRKSLEICEVADMIYLGLRQSTCGLADCWDDVDRWVRNMFAEMQLLETDWAYEYSEKYGKPKQDPRWNPQYVTSEKVPERCRGAWGGWGAANDWQGDVMSSIMSCCVGNAAMQLYRVWRDMVTYDETKNRFSVHLLLNRASSRADIDSHIPYKGQVDLKLKKDCEVALRIPEWTASKDCRCEVNGKEVTPLWEGRYMVVRGKKGDKITLKCPISERTETLKIVEKDYKVIVRGNEIVDIDPSGVHHPLFHRPKYRSEKTKWWTVKRFVSDEVVNSY